MDNTPWMFGIAKMQVYFGMAKEKAEKNSPLYFQSSGMSSLVS